MLPQFLSRKKEKEHYLKRGIITHLLWKENLELSLRFSIKKRKKNIYSWRIYLKVIDRLKRDSSDDV